MRTLKKTLCLVLALAMMVGLCAIGANAVSLADYADAEKITHKEAVAVLSALKVLEGDERGFRPNDPLTRAESAAFFTRLMAQKGAGVSSFTDMAGYDWAQPYVAFCESNKLIAGRGDGTFAPGENVTVVQWGKMCLVALGYDPAIEGLVGGQWEINTIRLMNTIDLCAGMTDIDYNAAITREAAAQMGLNTLKADMQEYHGGMNVDVNTGDGTEVHVNQNATAWPIANNSFSYYSTNYTNEGQPEYDGSLQFCEEYFPNLKLSKNRDDMFGVSHNYWWIGTSRKDVNRTAAKTIISEVSDNVIKTYDTNVFVTGKQVHADSLAVASKADLTVIVNGYELDNDITVAKTDRTAAKEASGFPFFGYKGATILLIDDSHEGSDLYGVANKAVIKVPYLAKVTKVVEATASADRYVELTVYDDEHAPSTKVQFTTSKFAKDDYILFYPCSEAVNYAAQKVGAGAKFNAANATAELAESVNGTLSQVNLTGTASSLTIGGVAYSVGSRDFLGPKKDEKVSTNASSYTLNTGITAYLSNGYIIGVVADSVSFADYVFAIGEQASKNALISGSTDIGYVKQDGTSAIATKYAKSNIAGTGANLGGDVYAVNKWCATTEVGSSIMFTDKKTADGKSYTVPVTIADDANDKEIRPSKAVYSDGIYTVTLDAKTTIIIRTSTGFSVYNGLAALPTINLTADKTAYALVPDGDTTGAKHAAALYIDLTTGGTPANDTTAKIFVVSTAPTVYTTNEKGVPVFYFTAIVDGAEKTLIAAQGSDPFDEAVVNRGFLAVPYYDSSSKLLVDAAYVTGDDATYGKDVLMNSYKVTSDADVEYDNTILTIGTHKFVVDAAAKVYVYDANKGPAAFSDDTALDDLTGMTGYFSLVATATSTVVKQIYVYVPSAVDANAKPLNSIKTGF